MPSASSQAPSLPEEVIDDVLYAARAGDAPYLEETLSTAATANSCSAADVLHASTAPESGNTALHYAAANGHDELLKHILTLSSLAEWVNQRNAAGNTALHWAAVNGNLAATKVLVGAGADMWVRNGAGNLAIFEAERAEKDDIVGFLLVEGGGKEEEGKEAETAEQVGEGEEEEEVEIARVQMGDLSTE